MDYAKEALRLHAKWNGKLETVPKMKIENRDDLSIAYTPGVAAPCLEIEKDKKNSYVYTGRAHTVAVISDGSAVLGLGNIGPEAGMPVMEGKCVLFKALGNVDAIPLCLNTQDTDELVQIISSLEPSFGGINLEDIAAPRCFEVEKRLQEKMNIPVFHDDQHGTAIVVTAALVNALKVVDKKPEDVTVVVSGTGAAGSSIIHMIHDLGVKEIYGFNINGIVIKDDYDKYDFLTQELTEITNKSNKRMTMAEAVKEADVFIGVSAPGLLTKEMVQSMKEKPIVFAMANPEPEIKYHDAVDAGAAVVGTGRSDFPNQINNVLAFPGLFRGALDVHATKITEGMKLAAAKGLASLVSDEELNKDYIIPRATDARVAVTVAKAVSDQAIKEDVIAHK